MPPTQTTTNQRKLFEQYADIFNKNMTDV